jgi:hypothetical protein
MSARFAAASSQYLSLAAPPISNFPFTVLMWINLAAVGASARTLFAYSDTATTNNYVNVRMTAAELISIVARGGGTENAASISTAISAGAWVFVVARFINTSNRQLSVLHANGLIETALTTTARAPAGVDTVTIGGLLTSGGLTEPWDGMIAEYTLIRHGVGIDDAVALPEPMVRQLAYGGPFSLPHIRDTILEHRSFRVHPASEADNSSEVFFEKFGRLVWVNNAGVTTGPHPPLPYWYVRPSQVKTQLVI